MLSLADTQRALHTAIVARAEVDLSFLAGSHADAEARLFIHRRHFRQSLTRALEKTFPAVVSLVDRRFFAYCADHFVDAHPPAKPCLFEYGAMFADFLSAFPPCAALPYIADVARLEWDMHAVFHALGPDQTAPERWLTPAVRVLQSPFPIHSIWQMALGRTDDAVALDAGGVCLAVYRDATDVTFEALTQAAFTFLAHVRVSRPLARAAAAASAIDSAFRIEEHIPRPIVAHLRLVGTSAAGGATA